MDGRRVKGVCKRKTYNLERYIRCRRFPTNQLVKVITKSASTAIVRKITITASDLPNVT